MLNLYALNETPIDGTATWLASGSGAVSLGASAHGQIAITGSGDGDLALSGSAVPTIYRKAYGHGALALSGTAVARFLILPTASGAIRLTASAAPSLHLRARASGALPLSGQGIARIVMVHYLNAVGDLNLASSKANVVLRPPVFIRARSEPLKIGGDAAALLAFHPIATGDFTLTGRGVMRGTINVPVSGIGSMNLVARAAALQWRQVNVAGSGEFALTGIVGPGKTAIPDDFYDAPIERRLRVPKQLRAFTVPVEQRSF